MNQPTYININYKITTKFGGGSRLALGTSGLGGVWANVNEHESVEAIICALNNGISVLDTSPSYRDAEYFVGRALQQWKGERPFISTKVGRLRGENAFEMHVNYTPDTMRKSLLNSLKTMQIDYVDLLFLHEPQMVPMENVEQILETLLIFKEEGLAKRIGIGGNPEGGFWDYVSGEYFDVLSSFNRLDACTLDAFSKEIPLIQEEDIELYAASPLHMGLLGDKFKAYARGEKSENWLDEQHLKNAIAVNKIAQNLNISLAELALRYLFSLKEADRVVIGPQNKKQLQAALSFWDKGVLSKTLFNKITDLLMNSKGLK